MDTALDHFQIATVLIAEGDRGQALEHLRSAYRAARASKHLDGIVLAGEIELLIAQVARNMQVAA